jgi:hypothetical protein
MRTTYLTLLLAAVLMYGCLPNKTYTSKGEKKDCKLYFEYVKENWKKNNDNVYEFLTPPTYDTTLSNVKKYFIKDCLIGLSKKQLKKCFGEPSKVSDNRIEYYTRKECFQEGRYKPGCARLTFDFDKSDKVVEVRLPLVEKPPRY